MARRDIEFDAEGVTLRGWFYPADGASGTAPTIVMAHGFSAVKEMYLDNYAEVFAAAGLNALVFDNRNFGASDGEPRQEIDPWAQVRDYRHAITYAGTLSEVDATGSASGAASYSGGHVLVVAAIDRRVKAVVVPGAAGQRARQLPRPGPGRLHRRLPRGVRRRPARPASDGDPPAMVPVVDEDPLAPSRAAHAGLLQWFTETHDLRAPSWRNEVTLRSVEMFSEYEPVAYLPYISPTPLLMLPAVGTTSDPDATWPSPPTRRPASRRS